MVKEPLIQSTSSLCSVEHCKKVLEDVRPSLFAPIPFPFSQCVIPALHPLRNKSASAQAFYLAAVLLDDDVVAALEELLAVEVTDTDEGSLLERAEIHDVLGTISDAAEVLQLDGLGVLQNAQNSVSITILPCWSLGM